MTPAQRVLVVDDEAFTRERIRDVLAADDVVCELVASGPEAQKAVEDPRVAVVVLDVRIAEPDAVGLLEALRAQRPALRVIALSSHSDQELVLEALRRGACDYLAKPLHDEELRLAVRRALEGEAVESRWNSLSERLERFAEHASLLESGAAEDGASADLTRRALAALAEILDARCVSLLELSADRGELLRVASEGAGEPGAEGRTAGNGGRAAVADSLAGLVLREGRALLIDDVASDPRCAGRNARPHPGEAPLAMAPVSGAEGIRAVLCASERPGGRSFGEEDRSLLRLFAAWLEARLSDESRRLTGEPVGGAEELAPEPIASVELLEDPNLELLREMCESMTREIEPERLLVASLRPAARASRARAAALYLIDDRTGRLVCEARYEGSDVDRSQLPRDAGLTGACVASGSIIATDEPASDPRFHPDVDTPESGVGGPLLVVPLRVRGRVLGVARLFPGEGESASSRLGELLAAPLSAATRNVLLYRSLLESVEDVARARREVERSKRS